MTASVPVSESRTTLPAFLTVEELAQVARLNKFTIYRWLKEHPERLPRPVRALGNRVLFAESAVCAWADRLLEPAGTPPAPAAGDAQQRPARRRGRPTKREQLERGGAAGGEQ